MARPREFDESEVLASARNAFWANGITNTSVHDLSEATGLSTGSIYKAFSSKEELSHRTLADYAEQAQENVSALLESGDTPLAGLEAWLEAMAQNASDKSPTRGCYAVMCATELAETDPWIRDRLRRLDKAQRGHVAQIINNANNQGELNCDPKAGADFLATTVNGLQVESRKGIGLDEARSILALALNALR
ncbi:MAG: TetR/AcrR family transcriptional regulator [Acidimicrobiales bacterium]